MVTEAIVCPTCRAADTSVADPNGVHTCVYCGARYRLTAQKPVAVGGATKGNPAGRKNLIAIAGLGALLAVAILGRFLFVTPRGASKPRIELTSPPRPVIRNPVATAQPEPEAPPEAPATATFALTARMPGYQTSFYAVGWVTNTSPYAVGKVQVLAVLLDDAGKEVGTSPGFIHPNELGPGEKLPIKILINKPPPFKDLRFEVVVRKATYHVDQVAGLRVDPVAPKRAAFGNAFDLEGKVFHEGTVPAKFVHLTVLAFDAQGTLVGVHDAYAQGATDVLKPGESARFRAPSAFGGTTPAKFEYLVDAQAAK